MNARQRRIVRRIRDRIARGAGGNGWLRERWTMPEVAPHAGRLGYPVTVQWEVMPPTSAGTWTHDRGSWTLHSDPDPETT